MISVFRNPVRSDRFIFGMRLGLMLSGASFASAIAVAQSVPNFGPNVTIISSGTSAAGVTAALNAVNGEAQFGLGRHAVLFMPGSYGSTGNIVSAPVGFYESVAGLGETPGQVTITGGLTVDQLIDGNLTQNFWRSQENLTEIPVGGANSGVLDWGVSQGASFRRINIQGGLAMVNSGSIGPVNPCANASGGFTADTQVSGVTNACSQQQWYTRNSVLNGWQDYVWNFVFSGVTGAPAQSYPGGSTNPNTTVLAATPVSREKPFLYVDSAGNFNVFVPTLRTNSTGTSWSGGGLGTGYSSPISKFFIAQPSNTLAQINAALASGQNLILTPGIYTYSGSINVTNANTIVLGMGYATLVPQSGTPALTVSDVDGVQVAGLLIDAGPVNSPVLLEVGTPGAVNNSHAGNPTSLNDVFFRIGGSTLGTATTSLQVDSGNAILDNIWAWRADHGNAGTTGWTANTADHGLVVNGNNVTALGLAVEHYQKEQVLWNGNGGETIFYQSELPYDPPSQAAWKDGSANGYPSYVVANSVCTHKAYGLGIYAFFNQGVNILEDNAMTVPNNTGINITDVGTISLDKAASGQITHVIDGIGATVSPANADMLSPVASFVGTAACTITTPTPAPPAPTPTPAPPAPAPPPPAPTPTPVSTRISINAGGGATGGFLADQDFVGGNTYSNTSRTVITANVPTAAAASVYQDEREGTFSYTIPSLAPGSVHTVRLHFAELYWSKVGQRVFNVAINNVNVLSNFDVIANAGSSFKAIVESFTATANSNGQIVIHFSNGAVDQPLVSGVEVW